jgi:hypothetical protein
MIDSSVNKQKWIIIFLNTGSPHPSCTRPFGYNVKENGAAIRYGACTTGREVILIL